MSSLDWLELFALGGALCFGVFCFVGSTVSISVRQYGQALYGVLLFSWRFFATSGFWKTFWHALFGHVSMFSFSMVGSLYAVVM